MPKPTIYFQGSNAGSLPANQTDLLWNDEVGGLGTTLTGDGNTVGIFLGALTNAQLSDDFDVIISHSAEEPVTGVQFYFQPTTNTRTGGTGFTSTDDVAGADADFAELVGWGDGYDNAVIDSAEADGLFCMFKDESEDRTIQALKTDNLDSLANSRSLDMSAKPGGGAEAVDSIASFNNYSGGDYAWIKLRLRAPQYIEDAGKRQVAFVCRLTYTF